MAKKLEETETLDEEDIEKLIGPPIYKQPAAGKSRPELIPAPVAPQGGLGKLPIAPIREGTGGSPCALGRSPRLRYNFPNCGLQAGSANAAAWKAAVGDGACVSAFQCEKERLRCEEFYQRRCLCVALFVAVLLGLQFVLGEPPDVNSARQYRPRHHAAREQDACRQCAVCSG